MIVIAGRRLGDVAFDHCDYANETAFRAMSMVRRIRQALEAEGVEFTQNASGLDVRLRRRP
jgi:hypothetical protein